MSIPTSTFEALPEAGAKVKLLTYFAVREDAQLLYGFATQAERELFEALISVSGVGPKLALAALSALPPAELQRRRQLRGGCLGQRQEHDFGVSHETFRAVVGQAGVARAS